MPNKFTYPIALGSASASHEEVEQRFSAELAELQDPTDIRNVFYSKIHKKDVRVHAVLTCSLMDQPERRGSNCMIGGNSLYGARWAYSINLQQVWRKLVPCQACEKLILDKDKSWNATPCSECAQWEMIRSDDMLRWKAPDGFPPCPAVSDGFLKPMKIEYEHLMEATGKAHRSVLSGEWSKTQAEHFLSYNCINTKTAALIIKYAQNMRALHKLSLTKENNSDEYDTLMRRQEKCPHEFQAWKCPSLWTRGVKMRTQVDAPMHLIFLGAVQNVVGFIHDWLRKHGRYSNFMRLAEWRMRTLVKFKLPWLKLLLYKGDKLGGWVSENYVSFLRVCKWFYAILDDLPPDDDPYEEPDGPQKDWRAVDNREWLRVRGLPTAGYAADLRARVGEYLQSGNIPPLLPPPEGSMSDLFSLISSTYDMVKSLMVFEVTPEAVELADFEIKRFLTNLACCERKLKTGAEKPYWVSCFTFPCLLNLPDHMKEFGPLKNLWEGGVRGEGSLRFVKPYHGTIGLKNGWEPQVITKVHLGRGLRAIGGTGADDDDEGFGDDEDNVNAADQSTENVTDGIWTYASVDAVYDAVKNQDALCLACDMNGVYGAVLRSRRVVKFTCALDQKREVDQGMEYFTWKPVVDNISDNPRGFELIQPDDFVVKFACVLLPMAYGRRTTLYAAIREDYTTFTESGEFL